MQWRFEKIDSEELTQLSHNEQTTFKLRKVSFLVAMIGRGRRRKEGEEKENFLVHLVLLRPEATIPTRNNTISVVIVGASEKR